MANEEDVFCLDASSDNIIDVIDLTKDLPRNRSLRSHRRRNEDESNLNATRGSSNVNSSRRVLPPLTLGNTENTEIEIPTKRKRMRLMNTTINLDDTSEEDYTTPSNNERTELICPICLETLCANLKPTTTRCGHIFCAGCLEQCLRAPKKACPTCQSKITIKSCTRLYI